MYMPGFFIDELRRVRNKNGVNKNTVAAHIMVENARLGEEWKQIKNSIEKDLRIKKRKKKK